MAHCYFRCATVYGICPLKVGERCPYSVHKQFKSEQKATGLDYEKRPVNDCPEAHPYRNYNEE